nr:hypothetical protein [Tanacetum cinerariifolium]
MYSFDLQNVVSSGDLTCLFAKTSINESNLWHMRLGHVNFKIMNKLVKRNLVRGLPSKIFENDHSCVAYQKGKQHKATCLDGCFSWPLRMKLVRDLDEFCGMKGIKREYSNARTLQQNRVAERKNRTLIEAAKTMLADSLFPITFWAEAVNTVCYVLNRALVTKTHNKTSYELLNELVNKQDQAYKDELDRLMSQENEASDAADALRKEFDQGCMDQRGVTKAGSTNSFNTVSYPVHAANTVKHQSTGIFNFAYDDDLDIFASPVQNVGAEADFNNMESSTVVSHIPTHRMHIDHPKDQILGDPKSAVQTRGMAKKSSGAHALKAIRTKWVYRTKKDERGIVVRNKARLVVQGHRQEEWIEYDEVFALVARIEAIRIFLAFASYMGFIFNQMDIKSSFLYGTIEERVYVCQPSGFIDPQFLNKVTPKLLHLHAMKRIFRYLKGQPKLGLWYPRDSPFNLEAYLDSDYAGANLDRKSTTGGLWIQNQMLDYGVNFMNTKIYIDNESTICIVKNPVYHSKTKHVKIRHHFIRDSYEKKLIQVLKIHKDENVADLLTNAFDGNISDAYTDLAMRLMISIGFLL